MTSASETTLEASRTTRRRDSEATRAAILEAATKQFARLGYDGAYLKDIAVEAGVDAALINRYFGSKEGLFSAVLKASIRPDRFPKGERDGFGLDFAKMIATQSAHHNQQRLESFQLLLRAATSPTTAPLLNDAVQARFMGPIRDWLGGENVSVRARLISAFIIGLLVERLVRDEPLSEAEREPFIERLAPILQALADQ